MAQATGTSTGGAQTLARGLSALKAVVAAPDGLSAQDVGDLLGVHRTIAYRLLTTLVDAGLVSRGPDGKFRGGVGLLQLTAGAYNTLRAAAVPILRRLANAVGSTVSLLVVENGEAVALAVVESETSRYRIVFAEGSTHPLDRGAAGHALSSILPPTPQDGDRVRRARADGYATSFAEVEPGAYGLAVPIPYPDRAVAACINLITYRPELIEQALPAVLAAAAELGRALSDGAQN
ncbi:IclR family transcriptional regulator [Nakamurella sp.]|uniref:IclR family transcriptional regulator n=1 Tax=Nakamurella sp. TaxID=1869182 RepID=UPI003B3A0268